MIFFRDRNYPLRVFRARNTRPASSRADEKEAGAMIIGFIHGRSELRRANRWGCEKQFTAQISSASVYQLAIAGARYEKRAGNADPRILN